MKLHRNMIFPGLILLAFVGPGGPETGSEARSVSPVDAHQAQRAVLVTGASSGIGLKITEHLAASGYFVYAGARSARDLRRLNAMENVQSIRLDVTIQEEIDAAVGTVTRAGRGLYGLVNNAGVAVVGPLIEIEEDDLQFQLDVNLYGPYRITKAFSPLIIQEKGRITTIGSISGILAGAFSGPYSMSKHAVEAFTDALAAEMALLDVQVSVVEPGNYQSRIFESLRRRMEENDRTFEGSLFEDQLQGMFSGPADRSQYKEPDEVAEAVLDFLSDENPKRRYMVVPNQREAEITIRQAIRELVQLNERHIYSYDRAGLIAMLDDALEASGT
ncbi:MAG: SDR family oxidoreductase [Gemmatimonadota bacterium]|nr:MAG: SDR family oxidoreductase [Gemmatimonadota bacterium]